ncbi:hypothetical protein PR202_ga26318 [Eleusine coracana subsp. coracana]|uniref:Dynamin-type G domain-containing protein n=1 Tax=Eleusine coracana subsp. coracana TaxID=191504 RepID=A0AAV5DD96_ELECO|nr:hypothetical protein PR202_ga26318 [Eleusine coracana subsp. coracana]
MSKNKKRRTGDKLADNVEDADAKDKVAAVDSGVTVSAIAASYNDQIRPLLDAVDRLRHLKVTQEGIQLPTIVVVGDQSCVLESLAGISLPRGQGICTRGRSNGHVVATSEDKVADAINAATEEIAGSGKGISDAPITLVVKRGVPDLTLIDLPGITRVPVQGQPEDIYDQIAKIIKEYIAPKESIILNVLSATVDFPTCESIRMSQQVDRTGERTLAVVTKADKSPEGLLEKVTKDDCVLALDTRKNELFLMEEISVLEETKGINLPNFLPRSAFHVMLKNKMETVDQVPQDLVKEVWEYVDVTSPPG